MYFYRSFTPMCFEGGTFNSLGLHVKSRALWIPHINLPLLPSFLWNTFTSCYLNTPLFISHCNATSIHKYLSHCLIATLGKPLIKAGKPPHYRSSHHIFVGIELTLA